MKLDQQIRPPFSPDEIQRLLGSLDQTDLPGCRNHALILFLLDTGVRVSECVSVRLEDVDWERRRVLVCETKNKHDRWVGFGERTAQAMRDYVERFRGDRSGVLFLTSAGEPMASGNNGAVVGRQNLMRPTDTHDANLLAPACCRLAGSASAAPACVPAESRAPMTDAAASRFWCWTYSPSTRLRCRSLTAMT